MDNEKIIWDFLKEKGLAPHAIAGVMGNLFAESGLISTNLQNNYEESLGMSDEEYTKATDDGSYKNFVHDSAGYGLAQWTYWSRKEKLLNFAQERGVSIGDLQMQLDFLWDELNNYFPIGSLNDAGSVRGASDIMVLEFERPADQSEAVQIRRAGYGQEFYDKFAGSTDWQPPVEAKLECSEFVVRVTTDALNIRSGPSVNNDVVDCIIDRGSYTIVDTKPGDGANLWGKLKSGVGWISLDYTEKV